MPLHVANEYGKITLSDKVLEDAISRCCQEPALYDNIWLAPKSNIVSGYNQQGDIEVGFSVYVRFGQSIKEIATKLSDSFALLLKNRFGKYPVLITVNVSGVKSQNLVRRNMDIIIRYTPEDPGHGYPAIRNEE